nr:hypothetical protein [Tanacetum cinerariifolium]
MYVSMVTSLSLAIHYPTIAVAPHMLINGYKNALAIAVETEYSFTLAEKVKEYLADRSKFAFAAPATAAASGVAASTAAATEETKDEPAEESDDDIASEAVEILERAHMVNFNPSRTPVDTESKLGEDGDLVCLFMHDPREPHFLALKRIAHYVRGTLDHGLQLFSSPTTSLVAFLDVDWAGCPTTRRSTTEYCSIVNGVAETCWLRNLLRKLHTPLTSTTLVYCENYADNFTKGLPSTLIEELCISLSAWCPPAQTAEEC